MERIEQIPICDSEQLSKYDWYLLEWFGMPFVIFDLWVVENRGQASSFIKQCEMDIYTCCLYHIGCSFFWVVFLSPVFFVFQSGALFLAICYILEQKPILCWILVLKIAICTVRRFFHGVHWFTRSFHWFLHSVHWVCHGFNWFSHGFNRFFHA